MNQELITRAINFAKKAHEGQERDGGVPYIAHPQQTALIVSQATDNPEVIAAAWLHDTIEDTDVTYEQLVDEFGTRVADLVNEVTHEGNKKDGHYFPRLHSKEGIMIKLADRLSNVSDMGTWSEGRKQRYLEKTKFWGSSPTNAQPSDKENI